MSKDRTLDQLWSTSTASHPVRGDRVDETERLGRVKAGDVRAAQALVERHLVASWQLALVTSLRAAVAADAAAVAWARTLAEVKAAGSSGQRVQPFRRSLLRQTRRAAIDLHDAPRAGLDLTRTDEGPFGSDADPSLAVPTFCLLPEQHRTAWWMIEVEKVPTREVPVLLDLPALSGLTVALDAVDAMRSGMLEAQYRSVDGDCARAVPRFGRYLAGDLVPFDIAMLHRHLARCPSCTHRVNALEDIPAVLTERMLEVPAELAARVLELVLPTDVDG